MVEQHARVVVTEPNPARDIAAAHPEIQFALVLARTIESISSDPELLRSAVYDLARQKLQELARDPIEKKRLMDALEIAIAGVEAHTKDAKVETRVHSIAGYLQELNSRDTTLRLIDSALPQVGDSAGADELTDPPSAPHPAVLSTELIAAELPVPTVLHASNDYEAMPRLIESAVLHVDVSDTAIQAYAPAAFALTRPNQPRTSRSLSSMVLRFAAVLAFFAIIAVSILAQQRGFSFSQMRDTQVANWFGGGHRSKQPAAVVTQEVPPAAILPLPAEKKPQRLLPATYGIFAESGGKLYELQGLQGRAPDLRVAVSVAITKPSETVLPDGLVRFVVYRRDAKGGDGSDAVDVRFIAQIRQDTTFDSSGKRLTTANENVWAIRNISLSFRAAPMKEDQEMYEVAPKDPDEVLSPGRYALLLKGSAYDFTVEGRVTDKRHCLDRLLAANGVFYSECPTLDAAVPVTTAAPLPRR
jgi:hypothetical protein